MCLTTVTKSYKHVKKVAGFGYKVFYKNDGKLYFLFYPANGKDRTGLFVIGRENGRYGQIIGVNEKHRVKLNRWITASRGTIDPDNTYRKGFHIYETKADAVRRAILADCVPVEVKWRGLVAEGGEDISDVLVACEMYVSSKNIP